MKTDQLNQGLRISMEGPGAARIWRKTRAQYRKWGVAIPAAPPLVLDFGLGKFRKTGLVESWIVNDLAAGYCAKYLFVFGGQTCPMHRHKAKHETFFVVKGRVRMRSGSRSRIMKPGDVFPVPRRQYHSFTGVGPALLLEVSTPCVIADNDFRNPAIPIGGNRGKERAR